MYWWRTIRSIAKHWRTLLKHWWIGSYIRAAIRFPVDFVRREGVGAFIVFLYFVIGAGAGWVSLLYLIRTTVDWSRLPW